MIDTALFSTLSSRALVRTSLFATIWALVIMMLVAAVLMTLTIGGFVVIVLIVMDAVRLAAIALWGLLLVGPLTLVLLPALALLFRRWPRLLRWILLPAGPLAGGWWGALVAALWLDESRSLDGFLVALGMIGGLTAGIVFALRAPRYAELSLVMGNR